MILSKSRKTVEKEKLQTFDYQNLKLVTLSNNFLKIK